MFFQKNCFTFEQIFAPKKTFMNKQSRLAMH
jgi:hypothetical protein